MSPSLTILFIAAGAIPGALIAWRLATILSSERSTHAQALVDATDRETVLREQLAAARAQSTSDDQMLDSFRSISAQVIESQSQQLIQLAEAKYGALSSQTDVMLGTHAKAVDDGLKVLAEKLRLLEVERDRSVTELRTNVKALASETARTREEAAKLSAALRDNRVRGLWGEVQLRRALELAGMDRHVDFVEQRGVSANGSNGRPDAVVALPNGRSVIIDSKVPLNSFLEALDTQDPVAQGELRVQHAKAVGAHVRALAARSYVDMVPGSVDMVLMFLPGEPFLAAALDADPNLFEMAADKGIHLVTPSSLVPILRGIALGWREFRAEQSAAEIHKLGVELHDRIGVFADRYARVGTTLSKAVDAYNDSVGSFDRRLLSSARKLADKGAASSRGLTEPVEIDITPRKISIASVNAPDEPKAIESNTSIEADNGIGSNNGAPS